MIDAPFAPLFAGILPCSSVQASAPPIDNGWSPRVKNEELANEILLLYYV